MRWGRVFFIHVRVLMIMKRISLISVLITLCSIPLWSQQTISELVKGCGTFVDAKGYIPEQIIKVHYEDGTPYEIKSYELGYIYNLDVVSHFKMKGYNTDLKRDLYKETEEYQQYKNELSKIRDTVKNTTFYYIHKFKSNYNVEKMGFLYEKELYEGGYVEFPGYINHGTLCIEYATKRFPKNKLEIIKRWGGSDYFYNQRAYLPVKDKQAALKIEDAGNNKGVLFLFKVDSIKKEKILFSTRDFILTRTEGIYIVNTQTGEVYYRIL